MILYLVSKKNIDAWARNGKDQVIIEYIGTDLDKAFEHVADIQEHIYNESIPRSMVITPLPDDMVYELIAFFFNKGYWKSVVRVNFD